MVVDLARALAIGIALGAVTGLPLGVVNVAIVEAAQRRGVRTATGIGVGGAAADGVHAALAFGGVAGLIVARPALATALYLVAGVVLLGYAVASWRGAGPPPGAHLPTQRANASGLDALGPEGAEAGFGRGVLTGVGLTLPNPAALGAWIAVAAALAQPSAVAGLTLAGGVALGSAAWFVALARLASRGKPTTSPALRRVVAIFFAVVGVAAIARGVT